jgi:general secretion pathway protein K
MKMKSTLGSSRSLPQSRGVAMVVVLWVIMVLSLLISGFAFTMHVETQVASFSRKELKAEMLARSGVEAGRMLLLLHMKSPESSFDALDQDWVTNGTLYVDRELGEGKYNVKVIDEESKLPINRLTQDQLRRLMDLLGIDPSDGDVIVDSILDWKEPGDLHRLNGAKSDYYESLSPPYRAKGAPLDRVEELLLIRGVTKEIYDGTPATKDEPATPGLKDLFTTVSSGQVNVNTASSIVLQTILGLDDTHVSALLTWRDGPDGIPGTDDDRPLRSVGEFTSQLPGANPQALGQLQQWITVNSTCFTVKSTGEVGGAKRTIIAILRRQGSNVMAVTWNEVRGGS